MAAPPVLEQIATLQKSTRLRATQKARVFLQPTTSILPSGGTSPSSLSPPPSPTVLPAAHSTTTPEPASGHTQRYAVPRFATHDRSGRKWKFLSDSECQARLKSLDNKKLYTVSNLSSRLFCYLRIRDYSKLFIGTSGQHSSLKAQIRTLRKGPAPTQTSVAPLRSR